MTTHFKNAVIQKGAHRVCVDLWTDLSNKTGHIQNTKITQQSKVKEKEMERKGTSIYLKPLMKGLSMRKICGVLAEYPSIF